MTTFMGRSVQPYNDGANMRAPADDEAGTALSVPEASRITMT